MADVKQRPYDGRRRRQQAQAARLAMLDAARDLLLDQGYAVTTLAQAADRAGVSTATVYKAFGNKPGMVKAVFDYAVAGDAGSEPIIRRERADRIRAEPDPARKIEMYADGLIGTLTRAAPFHLLARAAAESEPEMAAVWEQIQRERLAGMTHLAEHLADSHVLAPGLSTAEARDVLWAYSSPELYQLLVLHRKWPPLRYRDWVAAAMKAALLPTA